MGDNSVEVVGIRTATVGIVDDRRTSVEQVGGMAGSVRGSGWLVWQ